MVYLVSSFFRHPRSRLDFEKFSQRLEGTYGREGVSHEPSVFCVLAAQRSATDPHVLAQLSLSILSRILRTPDAAHRPPRAVGISRRFNSAAIWRRVVAPRA